MRNFLQLGMRVRFLEECPEHPTRKQAEEAARRAGYSEKKIPQKIHRFLAWAAERDRQRQPRLPEFFRDPNTGRLSHLTHETQTPLVTDRAPEPAPDKPIEEKSSLPDWVRDPYSGGELDLTRNAIPKTHWSLAASYQPRYMSIGGDTHVAGEEVARPVWAEPDFSELFPEPEREPGFVDERLGDAIGDPDALPQARFRPDEGPTRELILQMVR